MLGITKINHNEIGLRFRNKKLIEVLQPGWHFSNMIFGERIDLLSEKELFLWHPEFDEIIRSGLLNEFVEIVDLKDTERALLWVEGRFEQILEPGKHAIWKRCREITIERISAEDPQFKHKLLLKIAQAPNGSAFLQSLQVEMHETCLYFRNGAFAAELTPGFYAFWKNIATLKFYQIDLREKLLDMSGQDIITSDKVTLRLNAVISYRISDAKKSIQVSEASDQALYRESQLILRSSIGSRKLDDILSDKDSLAGEIVELLKIKAGKFGLTIIYFGIRDLILPGDMRELMNRVVEAQKEAEANQIVRREETAATRSQCNTAKMLENNPTLMRLRELEVLERIAEKSKLNLIVGEKGLAEKVLNLL